ncbi:MAG: DUF503 domain-containing protein [Alphaproteobacteria bacterium]|nr:DUF503 domain-containing protein [Alphaproteobacteria bacterium]MCB9791176.1 DUF503 domain-containing protein [Alphaproteobacteria bacterium]
MEQMRVAAMRLVYRVPGARSLKDKRRAANRIRDRVRAHFDVAISEVELLDVHGTLVFGVAAVGNDGRVLESLMERVTEHIDQLYVAERIERRVSVTRFEGQLPWEGGSWD